MGPLLTRWAMEREILIGEAALKGGELSPSSGGPSRCGVYADRVGDGWRHCCGYARYLTQRSR